MLTDASVALMIICLTALPRLKLTKKTASETIHSIMHELNSAIQLAAAEACVKDGRDIIKEVSKMVIAVLVWVNATSNGNDDEIKLCKVSIQSRLTTIHVIFWRRCSCVTCSTILSTHMDLSFNLLSPNGSFTKYSLATQGPQQNWKKTGKQ